MWWGSEEGGCGERDKEGDERESVWVCGGKGGGRLWREKGGKCVVGK